MKPICVVSCPIDTFSGYGARSRDFVKALIKVKGEEWDIKILPQRWGNTPWNALSQDDPLRQRFIGALQQQPDIWIQVTVPNEFQPVGKFNIGITAGVETDRVSPQWLEGMNRMDMNIVPSEHSARGFAVQYDKIDDRTQQKVDTLELKKPLEILFEGIDEKIYEYSR